ncbi:MAG: hypothetical protein EU542_09170 [Promethearchaeota archaeon]|nr:MAG: hypothetical protein EU542_09170 [Candidatus Lokiarchaeota archaeon]
MKIGKKYIKYLCIFLLVTNLCSILLAIFHYFIGLNIVVGTLFSILIVISWFLNILLIIFTDYKIVKSSTTGKRINRLGYGFLAVQIIAIFLLVGGLFLLNASWFTPLLQYSLILIGFLSFFIYGAIFSYFNIKALDNREVWKFE